MYLPKGKKTNGGEALASMGVSREEQEEIIETIHRSNR